MLAIEVAFDYPQTTGATVTGLNKSFELK